MNRCIDPQACLNEELLPSQQIDVGEFASQLLWRIAGVGLTPAGRLALRLGTLLFELRRCPDFGGYG